MKQLCSIVLAVCLAGGVLRANDPGRVEGDYVEGRTAEVFTGPCMLGSEWESLGREAIMAWRVSRGSLNGATLDGLSIVAVVGADRNLGSETLGAPAPSDVKTVVMVDARATPAQRDALVAMARGLAPDLTRHLVEVRSVPIAFERTATDVSVSAAEAKLDVTTSFEHSPTCGATQWFDPLAQTIDARLGLARSLAWSGRNPGAQWTQADRKASFVGTFAFSAR